MILKINYSEKLKDNIFAFFFNSKTLIAKMTSDNNELLPMYLYEAIETITPSEVIAYLNKQEYKALKQKAERLEGQQRTYQQAVDEVNNNYKTRNK
jgi:hypothetical protein